MAVAAGAGEAVAVVCAAAGFWGVAVALIIGVVVGWGVAVGAMAAAAGPWDWLFPMHAHRTNDAKTSAVIRIFSKIPAPFFPLGLTSFGTKTVYWTLSCVFRKLRIRMVCLKRLFLAASVALFSVIFLAGCLQSAVPTPSPLATPPPSVTAAPAPTATPAPSPTPAAFAPLKLEYEFSQGQAGQERKRYLVLWLNGEQDCGGRKALVGLLRQSDDPAQSDDRSVWLKATVYRDDGSMAASKGGSKSHLAFDNAQPAALDFDFFLTLNNLFAQAGRNFNTDAAWNSSIPVILRDVKIGDSFVNISVAKGDSSNAFATPCTRFSLLTQGNGPGEISACVAKTGDAMPLPFTVSLSIANDFNLKLKKVSGEKYSGAFYPQCLEAVKCPAVSRPNEADDSACRARGGGFDAVRDEKNCVTGYVCKTDRERIIENIEGNNMRRDCPAPSEELVSKALACRDKTGWTYHFGPDGCINDAVC